MEQSVGEIVVSVFNIAIMAGIALTIFMLVFQGINLLNSRGDPSAFSKVKDKIKNTLIGLGVLLLSYLIIYTINPDILENLELNVPEVGAPPSEEVIPQPPVANELTTYTFEEIPLGTITESILAGVSSVDIPCYQYETRLKDASGNIIIGNVVDQNKDGEIDEKDVLLNKDLFYCMDLLTSAYTTKVEYHLKSLISELNDLIKSGCACSNLYVGRFEDQGFVGDCNYGSKMLMPYNSGIFRRSTCSWQKCSSCRTPYSFCGQVCGGQYGCPEAQPSYYGPITNPYTEYSTENYSFKQYDYDTCRNRLEITCKTEEIKQLITGEEPRGECYDAGYIKQNAAKKPILFTLSDGVEKIEYFKNYFQKRMVQLSCAEEKMKIPWGERITLAEYEKLKSEATGYKVGKATFEDYDISRYCGEFNSKDDAKNDDQPCKKVEDERQYFYDGDATTFYFNQNYNNYKKNIDIIENQAEGKCTVIEGDMSSGNYAGVIPIGEVVDEAQEWGEIVVKVIGNISLQSRAIIDNAVAISNTLSSCSASRCTTYNAHYGYTTCSVDCSSRECSCPQVGYFACREGIPNSMVPDKYYTFHTPCYGMWCKHCSMFPSRRSFYSCGMPTGFHWKCLCGMITRQVPRPQYWVCDYENFCDLVKKIYWNNSDIEKDNFIDTNDVNEKSKRNENLSKIGYLQRFKGYAKILNDLSGVKIVSPKYNIPSEDIIKDICECGLAGPTNTAVFEVSSSYNYSCTYNYQSSSEQLEHNSCPYSYDGPVGMYWCQKENKYWSCPIITSQCNSEVPYEPPEEVEDIGENEEDFSPPEDEGDEEDVIECPYEYTGDADEYWCEKQQVYWSCPIREEDEENCLIEENQEDVSCPTDAEYENNGEIYWCERQQKYWSCPVDRETCDQLICPSGEEETGVYYCPADDNYWCTEPPEVCYSEPEYEIIDCPYDNSSGDDDTEYAWCEKQQVYWSCPIREEDEYLCYDDIVSITKPYSSENYNKALIAKKQNNIFLDLFNDIKDLIAGFFEQKVDNVALKTKKYLSEYLGLENAFARRHREHISCYYPGVPSCCVSVSTSQSFESTDSSKNIEIKNRLEILEKLSLSRKRLTGCVKGYSFGYKDNPTEVIEVISCMEGITGPGVLILPTFPYPDKSRENPPYNNCYPQNSDRLTEDERLQCFYNPLREGTESNPGCLLITKEYMDNYYCCN